MNFKGPGLPGHSCRSKRVVKNAFGILGNRFRAQLGLTGHDGANVKGCQRHCFNMCGVAKHAEETPG